MPTPFYEKNILISLVLKHLPLYRVFFSVSCCFLLLCPKPFTLLIQHPLSRQTSPNSRDSIMYYQYINHSQVFLFAYLGKSLSRTHVSHNLLDIPFVCLFDKSKFKHPELNLNHPFKPSLLAYLRKLPQIRSFE